MNNSYYKGYTIGYLTKKAAIGGAMSAPPAVAPPPPAPAAQMAPPDMAAPQGLPAVPTGLNGEGTPAGPGAPGVPAPGAGAPGIPNELGAGPVDPMVQAREGIEQQVAQNEQETEMMALDNQLQGSTLKKDKEQDKADALQAQIAERAQGVTAQPR